jgi:hypothetical protein
MSDSTSDMTSHNGSNGSPKTALAYFLRRRESLSVSGLGQAGIEFHFRWNTTNGNLTFLGLNAFVYAPKILKEINGFTCAIPVPFFKPRSLMQLIPSNGLTEQSSLTASLRRYKKEKASGASISWNTELQSIPEWSNTTDSRTESSPV